MHSRCPIAHSFIALLVLGLAVPVPPAQAADFDFSGTFLVDNEVELVQFEISSTRQVTIFTSSWVQEGDGYGFDPTIVIWNDEGRLVTFGTSATSTSIAVSNGMSHSLGILDVFMERTLSAGTYIATLNQHWNPPMTGYLLWETWDFGMSHTYDSILLADGFLRDNHPDFTNGPWPYFNTNNGSYGPEYERTGAWGFHILDVDTASQTITLPLAPTAVTGHYSRGTLRYPKTYHGVLGSP